MSSIKRWYFYIVSAISMQAIVWAVIVLLRNRTLDSVAFQGAVIIVGLPLFIFHWRRATRSEDEEDDEGDHLRLLYIFFMLTAFLIPIITNSVGLIAALIRTILGIENQAPSPWQTFPLNSEIIINSVVALLVLGLFGFYHAYLIREGKLLSDSGLPALLRRAFVYLFAIIGLSFLAAGLIQCLRWMITAINATMVDNSLAGLTDAVARLIVGLIVWLLFWRYAQRLYFSGIEEEQESVLRKFYLYLLVFIGTITVVSDLTIIGAEQLRRLLGLEPESGTGLVLSSLLVAAIVWIFHFYVLREDSQAAADIEAQANIRRIYWYLVAGVGLLVFLVGLGGVISVVINAVGGRLGITDSLRETLSWSTAGLFTGLLVWIIPWRKIQREVSLDDIPGTKARKAGVRRYYLYGFILLATLTFLGCAIFLVYAFMASIMGISGDNFIWSEIAQAAAYATMAVLVWIYHGTILRSDNNLLKQFLPEVAERQQIVIIDDEDGHLGYKLQNALKTALPKASLSVLGLTAAARSILSSENDQMETITKLKTADIIVGPWTISTPFVGEQADEEGIIAAVASSLACKVLIPKAEDGWYWIGDAGWKEETTVRQAVQAVKQIVSGEEVKVKKPLSVGRFILIVILVFFLLNLFFLLLGIFGSYLFF